MKKIILYIIGIILLTFNLTSCTINSTSDVVVSFYALEELTNSLVENTNISVKTLIKGTSEPHDYEPSARDVASLYNASLIIFNGNNLEEFEDSLDNDLKEKIVYATRDVDSIYVSNTKDPHSFTSVKQLKIMLNTIKESLINKFDNYKDTIITNYNNYYNELDKLDIEYANLFSNLNKDIIVGHEAFNYVARDYSTNFISICGISEEEPTAKKVEEIVNYIKTNNISVIYGEQFEENETVSSIAEECNITVKYLYTLEMMDDSNLSLIEALNKNIEILKE